MSSNAPDPNARTPMNKTNRSTLLRLSYSTGYREQIVEWTVDWTPRSYAYTRRLQSPLLFSLLLLFILLLLLLQFLVIILP